MTRSVAGFTESLRRRYPRVEVQMSQNYCGVVVLHKVVVAQTERGARTGSAVIRDIIAEADERGWTLALSPATDFGGSSRRRLEGFYRRLGFVPNRGRHRDFDTTEAMIRRPGERKASAKSLEEYRTTAKAGRP